MQFSPLKSASCPRHALPSLSPPFFTFFFLPSLFFLPASPLSLSLFFRWVREEAADGWRDAEIRIGGSPGWLSLEMGSLGSPREVPGMKFPKFFVVLAGVAWRRLRRSLKYR